MKSLTIYTCIKFDISSPIEIIQDESEAGNISPHGESLIISNHNFKPYYCTYNMKIEEDVLALVDDVYQPVSVIKKSNSFEAFYSEKDSLLIVSAPAPIAKGFVKSLIDTYPNYVSTKGTVNYNFNTIKTFEDEAKALYFSVDETSITSKHFFGAGIEQDDEVSEAIDEERGTYIMGKLDILGKKRTIGFSKKGTMVFYNKPSDLENKQYPHLELAIETLKFIQLLK